MDKTSAIPSQYVAVPQYLVEAVEAAGAGISFYAIGCPADSSDCSRDGACVSDGVKPCTDTKPCKDTPQPCKDVPPAPPTKAGSLMVSSIGTDYVTVRISAISKADGYEIIWRRSTTTSLEGSMDVGSSGAHTIYGLEPETSYVFNYRAYNDDGYGPFMSTGKSATTLSERPDDWAWWTRVRSDGDIDISADEWNAFCERINEFRDYCGKRQYSFTEVYRDDYISAAVVNQAVWAIQGMSPPRSPPSQVTSRQSDVTAAFFNGLMYALNSIE